jgi:5-hydroxyisourate hydrolase
MAVITTHLLNSVLGTHAGGVGIGLLRIEASGARTVVFERETDAGGRLSETVKIAEGHADAEYELVFQTGDYFAGQSLPLPAKQIVTEIVVRFSMPDPNASYHIPFMIAPNSYSVWWSS